MWQFTKEAWPTIKGNEMVHLRWKMEIIQDHHSLATFVLWDIWLV